MVDRKRVLSGPYRDLRANTGISYSERGSFQVDKGPSQTGKGLFRANLGSAQADKGLSGQHVVFSDRQNNLLGPLKPIQGKKDKGPSQSSTGFLTPTDCSLGPKQGPLRP